MNEKTRDGLKELERDISALLITNNKSLNPYIEVFQYAPENIVQQPLGTLLGFFEINEFSEDSAYIVNFLTSVVKKEYFANPRRSVEDSLDAALHKINVALSELVKHGNINWLGKLDAAICVLEKNNIHFSVTGSASIILSRGHVFSSISEGLAPEEIEPHPLKTFVNVSSGRLEAHDKVLVTSQDIFHILSLDEIKKNNARLDKEKFVQFLRTAMSNELEIAGTIVIDISEPAKENRSLKNKRPSRKSINAFSETAFIEAVQPKTNSYFSEEKPIENTPDLQETFIDQKTGHIYIHGSDEEKQSSGQFHYYLSIVGEYASQTWFNLRQSVRRNIKSIRRKMVTRNTVVEKEDETAPAGEIQPVMPGQEKILTEDTDKPIEVARTESPQPKTHAEPKKIEVVEEILEVYEQQEVPTSPKIISEVIKSDTSKRQTERKKLTGADTHEKESAIERYFEKKTPPTPIGSDTGGLRPIHIRVAGKIRYSGTFLGASIKKTYSATRGMLRDILANKSDETRQTTKPHSLEQETYPEETIKKRRSIFPSTEKMRSLFSILSRRQKLYALGALVLIFVVPYIYVKLTKKQPSPIAPAAPVEIPLSEKLASDKNIRLQTDMMQTISSPGSILAIISDGTPYAITENEITSVDNQHFSIPTDSGNVLAATYMHDLNLIFLLTDQKKVVSFSPVSKQFKDNNISIPSGANIKFIATYLTYLYAVDTNTGQIYRYPRADGGFGDKTDWLKDRINLQKATDVTLDDNIYIVIDSNVEKFFKGSQQQFSLEQSKTPLEITSIYTTVDLQHIYALDTKNSRLVQYDKSGSITAQYFNENLKDGKSIAVDEQSGKAYITTTKGIEALSL